MQHSTYLFVFFNQRAWDGVWFVLKVCSCLHVQISKNTDSISFHHVVLFFIDDNCRCHFFALIALFETADLDFCMNDTWIAYKHL